MVLAPDEALRTLMSAKDELDGAQQHVGAAKDAAGDIATTAVMARNGVTEALASLKSALTQVREANGAVFAANQAYNRALGGATQARTQGEEAVAATYAALDGYESMEADEARSGADAASSALADALTGVMGQPAYGDIQAALSSVASAISETIGRLQSAKDDLELGPASAQEIGERLDSAAGRLVVAVDANDREQVELLRIMGG